jgi:glycosyltransferase involved in cell wall biosynthesis
VNHDTDVRLSAVPNPIVSVVIAVHNGERFLRPCIESVLAQDYRPLECLVVDDASTDGTGSVARSFGNLVHYVYQARGGVAGARNRGISMASGDLVAFLDADDVWLPHKLTRQVALLADQPEIGLLYSGYHLVDEELEPIATFLARDGGEQIHRWLTFDGWGICFGSTGLVRREVFDRLGGFDEGLSTSADLQFCWRVGRSFDVSAVREPLALYRRHKRQMHRDIEITARDMSALYSEIFDESLSGHRKARRRASANLEVRLAFRRLFAGQVRLALASAARVLRTRPGRLVGAPVEAAYRRLRHRLWRRRTRSRALTKRLRAPLGHPSQRDLAVVDAGEPHRPSSAAVAAGTVTGEPRRGTSTGMLGGARAPGDEQIGQVPMRLWGRAQHVVDDGGA